MGGFFCFGKNCWAVDCLVINEIQIYPTERRFIELYNANDFPVDLTGWSVKKKTSGGKEDSLLASSRLKGKFILPQGYFLLTNEEGYSGNIAPDASWAKSNTIAKNNTVILYDNNQGVVDKVGFGLSADCEGSCALNPNENYSIHRNDFVDTNNNSADFFIQENPNPQSSGNGGVESESESPPPSSSQAETEDEQETAPPSTETAESDSVSLQYFLGDVVINELVSDPADEEVEWIELYNNKKQEVDLAGWTIEEGSGAKTNLEGILGTSGLSRFFVLEKPKGNLNNQGDIAILRDSQGNLIDQVVYGDWDDGNSGNNAPAADDPKAIARKMDGYNSYNNLNDFLVTASPTKGTSNVIIDVEDKEDEAEIMNQELGNYDFSNDIIISEIFPNPEGSDTEAEFIELYNKGDWDVNLAGWSLGDNSKRKFKIDNRTPSVYGEHSVSNIIKASSYLVIYRSESGIALNNTNDSVKLFQPGKDEPLEAVEYSEVVEGWSYNFNKASKFPIGNLDALWQWSEVVTPGEENIIKAVNHPPEVALYFPEKILVGAPILFDSSDTVDPDGDELKFSWDFGDGIKLELSSPQHTYLKTGNYVVKLIVSDGENEVNQEKIINVVDKLNADSASASASLLPQTGRRNNNANIIINEFLPNPAGSDTEGEWVELKNAGAEKINLLNWSLDDGEGGSQPYKFTSDLWLEPGENLIIDRDSSGLALNNSVDSVRLFDNFDELAEEIEYEKVVEGESYARGENGKMFWTSVLTPGEDNIISVSGSQELGIMNYESGEVRGVKIKESEGVIETTLEKIKEFESGDLVRVKGTVAVLPGVLGSQYFYIVGSPGIQIYNYKKDFPDLKIGDYIQASGELSVINGEQRLKTKTIEDMQIIEHREEPTATECSCEKISQDLVGSLITVSGQVVDKKSSIIYLDDGTDEMIVYIKSSTGIDYKNIAEGEIIAVTGILGLAASGPRLMPRFSEDIVRKDIESSAQVGQVLGEVMANDEWEIAARDKKLELFKYLLVIGGTVIMVLGGLLAREIRKG